MTRHDPYRTARILEAIVEFALEYGHTPTYKEIARRTGLASKSSVFFHLAKLRESGAIRDCRCGCGTVSLA